MTIAIPRLINWGRWVRVWVKIEPDGQALSYEGNWRPKGDGEEEIIQRSRRPAPDLVDAWDIEVACRLLPVKHHVLLKMRYIERMSDGTIIYMLRKYGYPIPGGFGMQQLRMSGSELDAAEGMALVLLEDALSMPAVVRMDRARAAVRRILRVPTEVL